MPLNLGWLLVLTEEDTYLCAIVPTGMGFWGKVKHHSELIFWIGRLVVMAYRHVFALNR